MGGETFAYDVTATDVSPARRMVFRHGANLYLISAALDRQDRLGVVVLPLTPRRMLGRVRNKLRAR